MYDIAYLIRGKTRIRVLQAISQDPRTATLICKGMEKHRSAVSRILLELEDRELCTCLNPKDKMHRFYKITEKGKKLLKDVKKYQVQDG